MVAGDLRLEQVDGVVEEVREIGDGDFLDSAELVALGTVEDLGATDPVNCTDSSGREGSARRTSLGLALSTINRSRSTLSRTERGGRRKDSQRAIF